MRSVQLLVVGLCVVGFCASMPQVAVSADLQRSQTQDLAQLSSPQGFVVNLLRKMTSSVVANTYKLVGELQDEQNYVSAQQQRFQASQQTEMDSLLKSIGDNEKILQQTQTELSSVGNTMHNAEAVMAQQQKALQVAESDASLRTLLIALQRAAWGRVTDFTSNAAVLRQWQADFADYAQSMLLPGSATDPSAEVLQLLQQFELLMNTTAAAEQSSALALDKLTSQYNVKDSSLYKAQIAQLSDQMNTYNQQRVTAEAVLENVILDTQMRDDIFQNLLNTLQITSNAFAQQVKDISQQSEMYSALSSNLLDFRTNLCPHMCSGNGQCVDTECSCEVGYEGEDCSRIAQKVPSPFAQPANSTTNSSAIRYAFDFGRSTHTFIASDELSIPQNISKATVSVWLQPGGGGAATVLSYATQSQMSELLLWIDPECSAMFLWVNSLVQGDYMGVPVANFSTYPLCDGHWHHLIVAWDGTDGNTHTYLDGRFWETHWNVFLGQQLSSGGRIVLGHNQVHRSPQPPSNLVPDAYIGVMSDFVFAPNFTPTPADAQQLFQNSTLDNSHPNLAYLHWTFNQKASNVTSSSIGIVDDGPLHVNAMAFGGQWVVAGARVCADIHSPH